MLFCPTCANCLIIQLDDHGNNKWSCHTCPYEFPIVRQMTTRQHLKRKQVDDVMGGEESWKNVDSTDGELSAWHSGIFSVFKSWADFCVGCITNSAVSKVRESKSFLHATAN